MAATGNQLVTADGLAQTLKEVAGGGSSVLYSSSSGTERVDLSETAANYTVLLVRVAFIGSSHKPNITVMASNGEIIPIEINSIGASVQVSNTVVSIVNSSGGVLRITKVVGLK